MNQFSAISKPMPSSLVKKIILQFDDIIIHTETLVQILNKLKLSEPRKFAFYFKSCCVSMHEDLCTALMGFYMDEEDPRKLVQSIKLGIVHGPS